MTLALTALLLALPAQAQDRTDPTGGATGGTTMTYDIYVQMLRDAAILAPDGPTDQPIQIDIGMVGIMDPRGMEIGHGFATNLGSKHFREEFFYYDGQSFDPAAPFGMKYLEAAVPWGNMEAGYEDNDYLDMDVWYTGLPNEALTEDLVFDEDVTRHSFLVVQQNQVRGWLLREVHTPGGGEMTVFDHWAFLPSYQPPSEPGDTIRMVVAPDPFESTAAYFAYVGGKAVETYSQIEYIVQEGSESQY